MLSLFRPLEYYVGPYMLTLGALCFVVLFGCVLKFSLEFVHLYIILPLLPKKKLSL
jgi:hypothetical protein